MRFQNKSNSNMFTLGFLTAVTLAPGTVVGATNQIALTLVVRVAVALALPAEAGKPFAAVASITVAGFIAGLVCAADEFPGAVFVAEALVAVVVRATDEFPRAVLFFDAMMFADTLHLTGDLPRTVIKSVDPREPGVS